MNERIPIFAPDLTGNEERYVTECIRSGWISSIGSFVLRFEKDFAAYCGLPFGVSLNSGTAALHLALRALNVGPGDEVIVPSLTFASTANAVLYQGATPVFVDSGEDSWNLDADDVARCLSPRTRAVIPVHLYGLPCDMDALARVLPPSVAVVEDCAESHGARYRDRLVGGFSVISCFSFYGNKIITTGEGGMCLTADAALHARMVQLRDHGMDKQRRYWHTEVGYNYRMTNLQAAVGCAQLERIGSLLERKYWIRDQYVRRLGELGLGLPGDVGPAKSVFWLFTVLLPEPCSIQDRDALIAHLSAAGVDSRPVFYPVQDMPPYAAYRRTTPNAARISARGITLPSGYNLTEGDIDRVCASLRDWLTSRRA